MIYFDHPIKRNFWEWLTRKPIKTEEYYWTGRSYPTIPLDVNHKDWVKVKPEITHYEAGTIHKKEVYQ